MFRCSFWVFLISLLLYFSILDARRFPLEKHLKIFFLVLSACKIWLFYHLVEIWTCIILYLLTWLFSHFLADTRGKRWPNLKSMKMESAPRLPNSKRWYYQVLWSPFKNFERSLFETGKKDYLSILLEKTDLHLFSTH